jgi:hypothetical protein
MNKPAIFADDAVDGPHARHLIAPAGRRGRHRQDADAHGLKPFERIIGRRGETPAKGQRLVDIGEHEAHRGEFRRPRLGQCAERNQRRLAHAFPFRAAENAGVKGARRRGRVD